jgi:hypothetical protein
VRDIGFKVGEEEAVDAVVGSDRGEVADQDGA